MIRFLMSGAEVNPPADLARTEFNLYLRFITTPLVFLITLFAGAMAIEGIIRERTRETWDSLIATPLTARDILASNMLAALWRMRMILATLFALWTIGLATGAIHPAGYLVRCLVIARVLPRCPQRLPILGVPRLAVDAYRNPRGASRGCRDLPDRRHHPDRVGAVPLARRPG